MIGVNKHLILVLTSSLDNMFKQYNVIGSSFLINKCFKKKMNIKSLYGGLGISIMGFGPFNALNFMFFYKYKNLLEDWKVDEKLVKFIAGGFAGMSALTVTYPTDLLRKHYQMSGFNSDVPKYNGILDGFRTIVRKEGIVGLYRGMLPSYIRIFPCLGIQFWCLEKGKELLK